MAEVALPEGSALALPEERLEIARAIEDLSSPDFGVYAAAARRLVLLGARAVPYLGSYGDRTGPEGTDRGLALIVLAPIFEEATSEEVGASLSSPYATVRAASAEAAGQRQQAEHAQMLIHLLEDGDLRVRRAAIAALRRLSQRFYGYRPDDSPEKRAAAISRWRELWGPG